MRFEGARLDCDVKVADLPAPLRTALASVGYGRADVAIEARDKICLSEAVSGEGMRRFAVVVNLATGAYREEWGSWGGANMFEARAVDKDLTEYVIPPDGAVILGHSGGGRPVAAEISVAPATLAPMLPSRITLSGPERLVLAAYVGLKSFARKDAMRRAGLAEHEIIIATEELAARGFLKIARNGSSQITTTGKNAIAPYRRTGGGYVTMPDGSTIWL